MSLFGAIAGAAFDVVTAPIEVVKDVATMGGACTDQREPYTIQRLDKLGRDLDHIGDELGEL